MYLEAKGVVKREFRIINCNNQLHHLLVLISFVGLCRELGSNARVICIIIILLKLARLDGLHVDHPTALDVKDIFLKAQNW